MEERPTSYLQIIFKDTDSTVFQLNVSGVSAMQVLAISHYLKVFGEAMLHADMQREAEQSARRKIAVPGADIEGILHR